MQRANEVKAYRSSDVQDGALARLIHDIKKRWASYLKLDKKVMSYACFDRRSRSALRHGLNSGFPTQMPCRCRSLC